MATRITAQHMMKLGLGLLGFPDRMVESSGLDVNNERFRDGYHAPPNVVVVVFNDMVALYEEVDASALLMAFFYLKKYPTKYSLAAFAKETEKTSLAKVIRYVKRIQRLKENKVSFYFCSLFFVNFF